MNLSCAPSCGKEAMKLSVTVAKKCRGSGSAKSAGVKFICCVFCRESPD